MHYGPKLQVTIVRGEFQGHAATIEGKSATYDYHSRKHVKLYTVLVHTTAGYRQTTVAQADIRR